MPISILVHISINENDHENGMPFPKGNPIGPFRGLVFASVSSGEFNTIAIAAEQSGKERVVISINTEKGGDIWFIDIFLSNSFFISVEHKKTKETHSANALK